MATLNQVSVLFCPSAAPTNKCQFRNFLVNTTDWVTQEAQILTTSPYGLAIMKGPVISIVTNIGSPVHLSSFLELTIVLTCFSAPEWYPHRSYFAISALYSHGQVCISLELFRMQSLVNTCVCLSILTCAQWAVGAKGTLDAQYTLGGAPNVLIPLQMLNGSGLCESELGIIAGNGGKAVALNSSSINISPATFILSAIMATFGLILPIMS